MKKRLLTLLSLALISGSSYAYTIGETYDNNLNDSKIVQSEEMNYYYGINEKIYKTSNNTIITTDSKNVIIGLKYDSTIDENELKVALGKYYPDYKSLSTRQLNNTVSNENFIVSINHVNGHNQTTIAMKTAKGNQSDLKYV